MLKNGRLARESIVKADGTCEDLESTEMVIVLNNR